ncbi:tenascin-R-like [Talpa occidentalis]|uniref:tenascin-R-like n=1 Tax=Talpa occidentalis TaxID=50954 RepID=UPI00188E1609|nr:tenascin-R-like [Talpa occidentalis]
MHQSKVGSFGLFLKQCAWSSGFSFCIPAANAMQISVILLLWLPFIFKTSKSVHYIPKNKQTTKVFIEWDVFPKEGSPEFYFLKYQLVNNFAQKAVKSILIDSQKLPKSVITLEEDEDYYIILQSIKHGQILSEMSFQTCGISTRNIKTVSTSTSVSFNWSMLSSNNFSVSIFLNNSSKMLQNNMVYEWDHLMPATLYTFTFEFKQLHLDFINIFQRLDIQVETGSCSQEWVAFKKGCYRISKESKPWKTAQQHCNLSLNSAHLVDIKNEEEKRFLFSHLRSKNQTMIWTGLNDLKKEGQLTWTDGSSFDLKKNEIFSFPLPPENERDCYILQQNTTGSNYFFTNFFCYLPLPYICEYELPSLHENPSFNVKEVRTTEIVFGWNNLNDWNNLNKWLKLGYKIIIKYYLDSTEEQHFDSLPPNTTEKTITQLCPGYIYRFLLFAINEWGAKTILSPVFIVETRPLSANNLTVSHVTSTEIFLRWDPPDSVSFHHYLVTILDVETNKSEEVFVEKLNTSTTIGNLKYFHHYLIYLFSVAERGTSSSLEKPVSVITGINPHQKVYVKTEDVGEGSIILQWECPQESYKVCIQIKSTSDTREVMKLFVKNANRFKIGNLIPGITYEIKMAAVMNGNLSELVTIQHTLSLKATLNIHEGKVTDSSIEILWNQADGNFQHYEITCINFAAAFMVQKVAQQATTVSDLDPATVYTFSIWPEKEGFKDITSNIIVTQTDLDLPSNLLILGEEANTIYLSWKCLQGGIKKFQISYCMTSRKEKLFIVIVHGNKVKVKNLTPGVNYMFEVKTVKGEDYSISVMKNVTTKPSKICDLLLKAVTTSANLMWNPTETNFTHYKILMSNRTFVKEYLIWGMMIEHTITDLTSGGIYNITMAHRMRSNVEGCGTFISITEPEKPKKHEVFTIFTHSFPLCWSLPSACVEGFHVDLVPDSDCVTIKDLGGGEYQSHQCDSTG